jgi:hypothetical protein
LLTCTLPKGPAPRETERMVAKGARIFHSGDE